jgi:hypothetical protein
MGGAPHRHQLLRAGAVRALTRQDRPPVDEQRPAHKTYTNMPGYDLVATNPDRNKAARIQVKNRWRTNAPGFAIKNLVVTSSSSAASTAVARAARRRC